MIYQQQTAVVEATIVLGSSFLSFSSAAVATTMVVATVSLAEMTDVDSAETTAHASSSFYFFSAAVDLATTTTDVVVAANSNLSRRGNRSGSPFFCCFCNTIYYTGMFPCFFLTASVTGFPDSLMRS